MNHIAINYVTQCIVRATFLFGIFEIFNSLQHIDHLKFVTKTKKIIDMDKKEIIVFQKNFFSKETEKQVYTFVTIVKIFLTSCIN